MRLAGWALALTDNTTIEECACALVRAEEREHARVRAHVSKGNEN